MKKLMAVTIAGVIASPALAAGQTQTIITGTLEQSCTVAAPANQTFNPASTALQQVGTVTYQCNFAGNASLKMWSQNGGQVTSPASAANNNTVQSRTYGTIFDGTPLAQLPNAATGPAIVRTVTTANTAQTGVTSIQLSSAATIAGTYTDTIFVSIAP
jgi:hypothetical protein